MAEDVDFGDLLRKPLGDIHRPPALPKGTYFGVISSRRFAKLGTEGTPAVEFVTNLTGAGEDVDPDELNGIEIMKAKLSKTFWITPKAEYRLKDFAASCGIDISDSRSLGEMIEDCLNKEVILGVEKIINKKEPTDANGSPNYINTVEAFAGVK